MTKRAIYTKHFARLRAGVFLLFSLANVFSMPGMAQESNIAIIAQSNFIFYGTIVKLNASNINIQTSSPMAIVRVDEVIDAVAPYDQMKGKEITVLLASQGDKKAGDQQVFYTTGWYYGKTLGVKEVRNNLPNSSPDTLKRSVTRMRVRIHTDSLQQELDKAIIVVRGKVIRVQPVDRNPALESEHDPELRKATIGIEEMLKGKITGTEVAAYFAASDDVMWNRAPKLTEGETGVFLLQSDQAPAILHIQGYTLFDKRDVQSLVFLPDIKVLLPR